MTDAEKIAAAQTILVRDIGAQRKCELLAEVLGPLVTVPVPSNVGAPPESVEKPGEARAKAKAARLPAAQPDAKPKAEGAEAVLEKATE